MTPVILYEIYPKRALLEPIDSLVLMDRCRNRKKAIKSARAWGGVVVKISAEILTKRPLTRRVISQEVIFVHRPRQKGGDARDKVTRKTIMGKLKRNYKNFRR